MTRYSKLILMLGTLLAAVPVSVVQAQSTFGAIVGISTGKLAEENDGVSVTDDDDGLMSIVLGLSMRKPFGSTLWFAPEAMYVAKGYSDENSDGKVSMSYVEIPLLLRYPFATSGMIKPFLTAGPQVSLQLSCSYYEADGDKNSCEDVYGEDDTYDKLDAGIVLGGGLSRERFSLSVRYDLSLMNIAKTDGWKSNHRALMILLGFDF